MPYLKKVCLAGSGLGEGIGIPERLGGRGSIYSSLPGSLGLASSGACGRHGAGGAGGVSEQKSGLAASTPLWELGLVPGDEGTSGEVEKTSLLGADIDQVGLKLANEVKGENAKLVSVGVSGRMRQGRRGTQVRRSSQEMGTAESNSQDSN